LSSPTLKNMINIDLKYIQKWSKRWLVKFNPSKTDIMIFSANNQQNDFIFDFNSTLIHIFLTIFEYIWDQYLSYFLVYFHHARYVQLTCHQQTVYQDLACHPLYHYTLKNMINIDLKYIQKWSKRWLVKFNPSKTDIMVFSANSHPLYHL
jgi:hypothetical protein